MNRRGFLKFLGMAPAIPAVLKGIDWEQPAGAAGQADTINPADHRHPAAVPPGTIWPAASPVQATGWLPCDGRAVPVQAFPALYEAIGQTYGAVDTEYRFKLPDMRASILTKGYNASSHDHGVRQASANSSHAHTFADGGSHTHWVIGMQAPHYMIKT